MLGKVIKYEMRACGRLLLPMFLLSLGLSGVFRLLLLLAPHVWKALGDIIQGVAILAGVLIPIAIFVLCFVYLVVRFYQSMVTSEAYLTFTLPVKTSTHILSRLIAACLYSLLGGLVMAFCAFIMLLPHSLQGIQTVFQNVAAPTVMALLGLLLLLIITGLANSLVTFYAALGIGAQFGRNRIIGSIVGYFALNTISGIVSLVFMALPMFSLYQNNEAFSTYLKNQLASSTASVHGIVDTVLQAFTPLMLVTAAVTLLLTAGLYVVAWYTFDKKLNLE